MPLAFRLLCPLRSRRRLQRCAGYLNLVFRSPASARVMPPCRSRRTLKFRHDIRASSERGSSESALPSTYTAVPPTQNSTRFFAAPRAGIMRRSHHTSIECPLHHAPPRHLQNSNLIFSRSPEQGLRALRDGVTSPPPLILNSLLCPTYVQLILRALLSRWSSSAARKFPS
ncbi:hypothetical protein FB451DRAFT_1214799 [Mycena latifolia]|nr:hypothetical protein FB451DRAFT_1214799 [Mycena latifolia]